MKYRALLAFCLLTLLSNGLLGQCSSEDFSADITNGCVPVSVKFTATGFKKGALFSWDFNGTYTSASPADSIKYNLYSATGTYDVKLRVLWGTNSCLITKNAYISISNGPLIKLYISDPKLCNLNDSVTFIDSSSGAVSRDFIIDGTLYKNAGKIIKHKFSTVGPKQVSMKVQTSAGCVASITRDSGVIAYKAPILGFNAQNGAACSPVRAFLVPFVFLYNGQFVTNYRWTTSGGTPAFSDSSSPTILYTNIGKYDIGLSIKTNTGCSYSTQRSNVVEVYPLPKISFTRSDSNLCNKTEITLINNTFGGPYPGAYTWILPNGTSYVESTSDSDTVKVNLPNVSGLYDIGMKYSILNCYTDTMRKAFVAIRQTRAMINSAEQSFCVTPTTVFYNDSGSYTDSGYSMQQRWVLKDSLGKIIDSSSVSSDSFTFTKFGKYSLELYLRSANGCSDSAINKDYFVIGPPKPKMGFSNKKPCPGEEVTINDATAAFSPRGVWQFRKWVIYDRDFTTILFQDTMNKVKYSFADTGYYKIKLIVYNVLGCIDSISDSTTLHVMGTKVDFTIDKTNVCRNETFKLEAKTNSSALGTTYGWEIVNENDSAYTYFEGNINPLNKTVGGVGKYSIRCTAYTKACTTSVLKRLILNVSGILYKGFQDSLESCSPVKFKLSSQKMYNYQKSLNDSGIAFRWYSTPPGALFSDSLADKTKVTFPTGGCYTITILATNADGCQSNWLNVVNTCIGNNANFTSPLGACYGDSIKPINTSSIFAKAFYWKVLGPSSNVKILPTDTSTNPVISLDKTGWHEIKLYVTTNIGCIDSFSRYIEVVNPKAKITSNDSLGYCGPHLATFTYAGSPADNYTWYWDDGSLPFNTGSKVVSHLFDIKNGKNKFNVSLKIVDQYGCKDSSIFPSFIKIKGPVPYFTVDNFKGCEPLNVTFDNKTTGAAKVQFYDDQGTLDTSNASQFFRKYSLKQPGDTLSMYYTYMVATDSSGSCTKAYRSKDTILVYKKPTANFTFNDSLICINDKVYFTNTSIGATRLFWDLNGDDIIEDSVSPTSFRYKKKGYYFPKLIALNKGGCPDTLISSMPVEVFPVVKGVIYTDRVSICQGDSIQFFTSTDTVYPYKLNYLWYFFRNNSLVDSSTEVYPKKKFSQPGYYSASVVITNIAGCSDSLTKDSVFYLRVREPYVGTSINFVSVIGNKNILVNWKKTTAALFEKYVLFKSDFMGRRKIYESVNPDDTSIVDSFDIDVSSRVAAYEIFTQEICNPLPLKNTNHTNILLTTSAFNLNAIKVTWTSYGAWNSNLEYDVYRNVNSGFVKVKTTKLNTWIDYDVCDSVYSYYIIARNLNDSFISMSNESKTAPVFVADKSPSHIKSVSITADDKMYITWDTTVNPQRTKKYELLYSKSPYNLWASLAETNTGSYTYNHGSVDEVLRFVVVKEDVCGNISDTGVFGNNIYLQTETIEDTAFLFWNSYRKTRLGMKEYAIQLANDKTSSFDKIGINKSNDSDFVDSALHNLVDQYFCYRVAATSKDYIKDTSYSNVSCVSFNAKVFIPNAFTPNRDDLNECFKPVISFVYSGDLKTTASLRYIFTIYDRWGEKIYETTDPAGCWDGMYKNKPAPAETYMYRMSAVGFKDKEKFVRTGSFLLLR